MEHCEHYAFDITLIGVFLQLDAKPYNLTVISVLWGDIYRCSPQVLPFTHPLTSPGWFVKPPAIGEIGFFSTATNEFIEKTPKTDRRLFFSRNYRAKNDGTLCQEKQWFEPTIFVPL